MMRGLLRWRWPKEYLHDPSCRAAVLGHVDCMAVNDQLTEPYPYSHLVKVEYVIANMKWCMLA